MEAITVQVSLFHCTPASRLAAILQEGLRPDRSESSLHAVFLSGTRATAENYACMKDEPCVVLEVVLDESLLTSLAPDNYELPDLLLAMSDAELGGHGLWPDAHWGDCTWQQSLAICDQVACLAPIPPQALRVVKVVEGETLAGRCERSQPA